MVRRFIIGLVYKNKNIHNIAKWIYIRLSYVIARISDLPISDIGKLQYEISLISSKNIYSYFGYYDKIPWNERQDIIIFHQFSCSNSKPSRDTKCEIVYLNCKTGQINKIGETLAWSYQQGSMLQWYSENEVIYNDFRVGKYVSIIKNVCDETEKILPCPIYTLSHDKSKALCLNFARLNHANQGYGYSNKKYTKNIELHPDNDGIWLLDIKSKEYKLIISLNDIYKFNWKQSFEGAFHYFNHIEFNPKDSRFVFLHRWFKGLKEYTTMYTADIDGSNLYKLSDHDMTSHFTWRDNEHLLAWANHEAGLHYYLYKDQTDEVSIVGEGLLTEDGHPSYSPDKRWILTDTYPDKKRFRSLILYDTKNNLKYILAKLYSPFVFEGIYRSDLHPRFSQDANMICVDSSHEGFRGVYMIHLRDFWKEVDL